MSPKTAFRIQARAKTRAHLRQNGGPVSMLMQIPWINALFPLFLTLQGYRLLESRWLLGKRFRTPISTLSVYLSKSLLFSVRTFIIQIFILLTFSWNPLGKMLENLNDLLAEISQNGIQSSYFLIQSISHFIQNISMLFKTIIPSTSAIQSALSGVWFQSDNLFLLSFFGLYLCIISALIFFFFFIGFALAMIIVRRKIINFSASRKQNLSK